MAPTYFARKNALQQPCATLEEASQQLITWAEETEGMNGYSIEPCYGPEYGPQGWGYRVSQWGRFVGRLWIATARAGEAQLAPKAISAEHAVA